MANLIVFEGLDNLGKTTQINLLKHVLPPKNFVFTSCPGGSETANQVRAILASETARETMGSKTEVLLYAASHADVTHSIILPALYDGKHVICDRFFHSGLAYQSGLKGNPEEDLLLLHERFSANLQPDIIFYFRGDPYPSTSSDNPGGYDGMSLKMRKKVTLMYDKYLNLGGFFLGDVIPIVTDGRAEFEIHGEILTHLQELNIYFPKINNTPTSKDNGDCTYGYNVSLKDIQTVGDLLLGLRKTHVDSQGTVYVKTKERNSFWKMGEYGSDNDIIYYPNMLGEKIESVKGQGHISLDYYVIIQSKTKAELERILKSDVQA